MAFQQQQQRPRASRPQSYPPQFVETQVPVSPGRKRSLAESQEWILFSPISEYGQSRTSQTPRTATHLSDFGSLETHVRSQALGENQEGDATCLGTEIDDDGFELDSLDDGLHAFHHPFSTSSNHLDQSGGAVLPTHDGLGTFPSADGLQDQLWQFERHNPHRRRQVRRRSSIQRRLDVMEEEGAGNAEEQKTAWIEQWRLEQSRAVLEEIERETRRWRRRMSKMSTVSGGRNAPVGALTSADEAAGQRTDSALPEELEAVKDDHGRPNESFWRRITRRVIEDLIGLDEATLSVIFGEQLPEDPSPTPTRPSPIATAASLESRVAFQDPSDSWEIKLIERIARELGILVHQFSEHSHGAFSTYQRVSQQEPDYAGIPIAQPPNRQPSLRQQRRQESHRRSSEDQANADPTFSPTLPPGPLSPTERTDTSLWGIEEEPSQAAEAETEAERLREEREYWERDVDVKMIFQYLKSRFSSASRPSPPEHQQPAASGPLPAAWANNPTTAASALGTSPESLRRAEVIRRQHPLVSRAAAAAAQHKRRESLHRRHHMQTLMQRRVGGSSSCAPQSTRRRSGSSRLFWDLGGSVGSGSGGPAMSSGLGGWGEV